MERSKAEAFLSFENVSLSYGDNAVLRDFSLRAFDGEILAILGLVGAGKTRILRLAAGLESPQSGAVRIARPTDASFIFQDDLLIPWLTVEQNLRLCQRAPDEARLNEAIAAFGLQPLLQRKPAQLSGGQRQKTNCARAFINDDRLLLMDEAFNGLDPLQKRDLLRAFLELQRKSRKTVLFVTHDVREALFVADRVALLSSRAHAIESVFDNPLKGRFEDADLFGEEAFRLHKTVMDFYGRERTP